MRWWLVVWILAFVATGAYGQSVNARKKELQDLRRSIVNTQKQLESLRKQERSERNNISAYTKRRHRISAFIVELQQQLQRLEDSAAVVRTQIRSTAAALSEAEQAYNQAANALLRFKAEHRGNLRMPSSTRPLFRSLSAELSRYRKTMLNLKDSLHRQQSLLNQYSEVRSTAIQAQSRQEQSLKASIQESTRALSTIRKNKQSAEAELRKKQHSVAKLRAIIAEQVAAAARKERAEREARRRKQRSTEEQRSAPETTEPTPGFAARSLPWPTSSRKILHGYGAYKSPETGSTLDNPGIDIATPVGSSVRAVAAGTVSSVTWLPGFGSLVIIDHGNGIRTVYANLSSVAVGKGAKVKAGTPLGASGENIDGASVHFEVWHGKARQDPRRYLK